MYFSATFPYFVLICFFVRSLTLEGASDGIQSMFAFKVSLKSTPHPDNSINTKYIPKIQKIRSAPQPCLLIESKYHIFLCIFFFQLFRLKIFTILKRRQLQLPRFSFPWVSDSVESPPTLPTTMSRTIAKKMPS